MSAAQQPIMMDLEKLAADVQACKPMVQKMFGAVVKEQMESNQAIGNDTIDFRYVFSNLAMIGTGAEYIVDAIERGMPVAEAKVALEQLYVIIQRFRTTDAYVNKESMQ